MGTQQMLLLVLGIVVVGVAIVVGIWMFGSTSVTSNRDAIINDLLNLGQYAYRYKLRPEPLGGGGRKYDGFTIPSSLASNENALYSAVPSSNSVAFTASSTFGYGNITVVLDSAGTLSTFTFGGDFQ